MKRTAIDSFSVQNVVYHLLDGNSLTKLTLNIMLHTVNLMYKSCFGEILWSVSEFYLEDNIQKSVWVDDKFGFLSDDEIVDINHFNAQSDHRHCKMAKSLNGIVQMVRVLYKDLSNDELVNVALLSGIPLSTLAEEFTERGYVSEFKRYGEELYMVTFMEQEILSEIKLK